MIRLALLGASGRMGRAVLDVLGDFDDLTLGVAVDAVERAYEGVAVTSDCAAAEGADVAVDFSTPGAVMENLPVLARFGVPCVVCVTGFTPAQHERVVSFASSVPLLLSSNASQGASYLARATADAAGAFPDADVEIVETHHAGKADAPSGTALSLFEAVASARPGAFVAPLPRGKRREGEVGVSSVRGGGVVGEHVVRFIGEDEELALVHRVFSRRAFARGALRAARRLVGRPPGLYSMQDVMR